MNSFIEEHHQHAIAILISHIYFHQKLRIEKSYFFNVMIMAKLVDLHYLRICTFKG